MVINDIDFPREILDAISKNEFVVFAGAGVSVGKPTGLPNFLDLTCSIAEHCGETYDKSNERIDEYLGDLQRRGVKINELVANRLTKNNPKPNEFHYNILNLFTNLESVRIVTTNQDCMFEDAVTKLGKKPQVYNSPALPYGDNFNGIVHLHGNVKYPQDIIVTDEGFGKAYMLNGYATRFIVEMVKKYVVLFIGYSYDDVIVRYLTTSIPSNTFSGAYILSCDNNEKLLSRTGIKTIRFHKGKYDVECDALKKIGEFTKRGLLDWKKRIGGLNVEKPPLDNESQDEILEGIKDYKVQEYLCERISGKEWLFWLDEKGLFDSIFNDNSEFNSSDVLWADWIFKHFIKDELFTLIKVHNNVINYRFCEEILWHFITRDNNDNYLFEIYLTLMSKKIRNDYYIYEIIKKTEGRGMIECMWKIFSDTLDYDIIVEKGYSYVGKKTVYNLTYKWKIRCQLLKGLWKDVISKHIHCFAYEAIELCTKTIKRLYYDLNKQEMKGNIYLLDMLDIEGNEHYHYQNQELYVVFNIIKSAFYHLYITDKKFILYWIDKSLDIKIPLITKIVLFVIRDNNDFTDDEKYEMVINRCNFHDLSIREQIFKLIAKIYDDLDENRKQIIINKILDVNCKNMKFNSDEEKEYHVSYMKYNWFVWLESQCTNTKKIDQEIKLIKEKYPLFKPRKRPDLVIGPAEFSSGICSPISSDNLRRMDAENAYKYIDEFKEGGSFGGPDRYGLLCTLSDVVKEDIKWAVNFIDKMIVVENWQRDIWEYIFIGLRNGVNNKNDFIKVIKHLNNDILEKYTFFVSQFILEIIDNDDIKVHISNNLRTNLFKMVKYMWEYREINEMNTDSWTIKSLNDTTGILSYILISLLCQESVDQGIPHKYKSFINKKLLDGNAEELIFVLCASAEQLFFRDNKWTTEKVLCYLECVNNDFVQLSWEGFIYGLNSFDITFMNTVLPIFHRNVSARKLLNTEHRNQFIYAYILMLVYIESGDIYSHIGKLLKDSTDEDKYYFAFSIKQILENMLPDQRSELWNRWLKEYWKSRNENVPERLCEREFEEMLEWTLLLENEFDEAVELVCKSEINKISYFIMDDLKNSKVIDNFPVKVAELLIYILKRCDLRYSKPEIIDIVEKLKKYRVSDEIIRELNELVSRM